MTARAFLDRWPAVASMSAVESWRELSGGEIEFTMKRLLRSAARAMQRREESMRLKWDASEPVN
jgi:hypothetical protein